MLTENARPPNLSLTFEFGDIKPIVRIASLHANVRSCLVGDLRKTRHSFFLSRVSTRLYVILSFVRAVHARVPRIPRNYRETLIARNTQCARMHRYG